MYKMKKISRADAANTITKSIVDFLIDKGHSASRVNTQGQWNEEEQRWQKSGSRNGYSDVSCCLKCKSGIGIFLAIEVKFDKDKQSPAQKSFQKEVEAAGGIYYIARATEAFDEYYNKVLIPNYIDKY